MKLKYDDEADWNDNEDDPEEEAAFIEMRKVNNLSGMVDKQITFM